jgi:hypothetical protein
MPQAIDYRTVTHEDEETLREAVLNYILAENQTWVADGGVSIAAVLTENGIKRYWSQALVRIA